MQLFSIKKNETITKTFRIPVDLLKEMETLAQNNNISLNNLLVQCCEYALEHLASDTNEKEKNNEP